MADAGKEKSVITCAIMPQLVDITVSDGVTAFCFKDGDNLTIRRSLEDDACKVIPPPLHTMPWKIADSQKVVENYENAKKDPKHYFENLYLNLMKFLMAAVDLPGAAYYHLITCWIFHTYVADKFQYTPFIALYALPERGKSRLGKSMIWTAYRGLYTETLREAYLIRLAKEAGVSVFLDLIDFWKKATSLGCEDMMLTRFEKGAAVPRVLQPDKSAFEGIKYYETFGPTIIAVNEPLNDILETRCIQINMPESSRSFDNQILEKNLLSFRERLLAFRAMYMDVEFPDMDKVTKGRLGDISRPLLQVAREVYPAAEEILRELIVQMASDRIVARSESIDAQILRVVCKLTKFAERGQIPVKTITDEFNKDKQDRFKYTYQFMGKRLGSFGFYKGSTSSGNSTILIDESQLKKLYERFGVVDLPIGDDTGDTGVTGGKLDVRGITTLLRDQHYQM